MVELKDIPKTLHDANKELKEVFEKNKEKIDDISKELRKYIHSQKTIELSDALYFGNKITELFESLGIKDKECIPQSFNGADKETIERLYRGIFNILGFEIREQDKDN